MIQYTVIIGDCSFVISAKKRKILELENSTKRKISGNFESKISLYPVGIAVCLKILRLINLELHKLQKNKYLIRVKSSEKSKKIISAFQLSLKNEILHVLIWKNFVFKYSN